MSTILNITGAITNAIHLSHEQYPDSYQDFEYPLAESLLQLIITENSITYTRDYESLVWVVYDYVVDNRGKSTKDIFDGLCEVIKSN